MATQVREKRKFVADAAFYAALNEVLIRELAEDGYSGTVELRVTATEVVSVEIPTKEEASPVKGGGMGGLGERGSTKTKQ